MAATGIYLRPVFFSLKGSMQIALTLLTSGDHFFSHCHLYRSGRCKKAIAGIKVDGKVPWIPFDQPSARRRWWKT
jgi:hypothetical protein